MLGKFLFSSVIPVILFMSHVKLTIQKGYLLRNLEMLYNIKYYFLNNKKAV